MHSNPSTTTRWNSSSDWISSSTAWSGSGRAPTDAPCWEIALLGLSSTRGRARTLAADRRDLARITVGTSTWVSAGGEGADPQAAPHRSGHGPRRGPPERPLTAPCIDQLMHTSGVAGLGHPPEFREPVAPGLGAEGRNFRGGLPRSHQTV